MHTLPPAGRSRSAGTRLSGFHLSLFERLFQFSRHSTLRVLTRTILPHSPRPAEPRKLSKYCLKFVCVLNQFRVIPFRCKPLWHVAWGNGKCWNVANVEMLPVPMLPIVNWAATSAAPPVAARGTLALPWRRSRGDRPTKRLRFTSRESPAQDHGSHSVSRRTAVADRRSCSACAGNPPPAPPARVRAA